MRLIILITLSLCASCVSNPDAEAHRLALWNFHYEKDIDNEWRVYDRIDIPFMGDCEDYSGTLQRVIGGDIWYVIIPNGIAHAVLVKNGTVYDNMHKQPISRNKYNGDFKHIMRAE